MFIFIVTKFGADGLYLWMLERKQSQMQQFFTIQDQITPVVLVQLDP